MDPKNIAPFDFKAPPAARAEIPAEAFVLPVGEQVVFGDNGEGAKTVPIKLMVRSSQPIRHWYWGKIAHDLGTVQHKNRISLDWCHGDELVGYGNKFETDATGLWVSGALTPWKPDDHASEIIAKHKMGVPWESSINWGGGKPLIEVVPENHESQVNGEKFSGPGVIIRNWTLRNVAVCPLGADHHTSAAVGFTPGDKIEVEFVPTTNTPTQEVPVSKQAAEAAPAAVDPAKTQAQAPASQEAAPAAVEPAKAQTAAPAAKPGEAAPAAVEPAKTSDGKRFLEAFGQQGAVWFAEGKSFEEAQGLFTAFLKSELAAQVKKASELQDRIDAAKAQSGAPAPIPASPAPAADAKKRSVNGLYGLAAAIADEIRMPNSTK